MLRITFLLCGFFAGLMAADGPRYSTDIKPILADNCYECHGMVKSKAGLRLDTPEGIRKGTKSHAVLVPGDPTKSRLYVVTTLSRDDDDFMPVNGAPLKKAQTELLRAWIAAGAVFDNETPGPVLTASPGPISTSASTVESKTPVAPSPALDSLALRTTPPVDPASDPKLTKLLAAGMTIESVAEGWMINAGHLPRGITEEHLGLLAGVGADVWQLNLAGSGITDRQIRYLGKLTHLDRLNLSRNPTLGDAALSELVGQPAATTLTRLNLYATGVTDRAVESLARLTNLEEIQLWKTTVTPAGIDRLRKALPACRIILGPTDLPNEPMVKSSGKKKKG